MGDVGLKNQLSPWIKYKIDSFFSPHLFLLLLPSDQMGIHLERIPEFFLSSPPPPQPNKLTGPTETIC